MGSALVPLALAACVEPAPRWQGPHRSAAAALALLPPSRSGCTGLPAAAAQQTTARACAVMAGRSWRRLEAGVPVPDKGVWRRVVDPFSQPEQRSDGRMRSRARYRLHPLRGRERRPVVRRALAVRTGERLQDHALLCRTSWRASEAEIASVGVTCRPPPPGDRTLCPACLPLYEHLSTCAMLASVVAVLSIPASGTDRTGGPNPSPGE
jgi:hypothetical protein